MLEIQQMTKPQQRFLEISWAAFRASVDRTSLAVSHDSQVWPWTCPGPASSALVQGITSRERPSPPPLPSLTLTRDFPQKNLECPVSFPPQLTSHTEPSLSAGFAAQAVVPRLSAGLTFLPPTSPCPLNQLPAIPHRPSAFPPTGFLQGSAQTRPSQHSHLLETSDAAALSIPIGRRKAMPEGGFQKCFFFLKMRQCRKCWTAFQIGTSQLELRPRRRILGLRAGPVGATSDKKKGKRGGGRGRQEERKGGWKEGREDRKAPPSFQVLVQFMGILAAQQIQTSVPPITFSLTTTLDPSDSCWFRSPQLQDSSASASWFYPVFLQDGRTFSTTPL